jgi:hypothetical protein
MVRAEKNRASVETALAFQEDDFVQLHTGCAKDSRMCELLGVGILVFGLVGVPIVQGSARTCDHSQDKASTNNVQ